MKDSIKLRKRDGFASRWGFILACIGSAVGMGNIWRFPVLVSQWGGMTFLIPYLIFVALISCTGVIAEFSLGRMAGAGPVGAFAMCTEQKGSRKIGEIIGIIPILGSLLLAIGYTCVMGWVFKYFYYAVNGNLTSFSNDMDKIGSTFGKTASSFGANIWLVLAVFVSFIILSKGISKGIEKVNKVMMPVLFFLFLGLAIYIFFQPNSLGGYKYIFTINLKGLLDIKLWIYAFGQAFFSLSVAGNGSVIYGSYLSKEEDIPYSAKNVAIFDTLAALLASFVIIPAMAVGGATLSKGGPGLLFIYIVNVINSMIGGRILIVIFYLCILFAGVTSIINLYEVSVSYLEEKMRLNRVVSSFIIHFIGGGIALLIQGIVAPWMDFVSIYICPLGAFLAGIMFFWVYGKDRALNAVNLGANKKVGSVFYFTGKYIYCALAILALIIGAILGGIG